MGIDARDATEVLISVLVSLMASMDIRAARASPSMTLYYTDGGSIQTLKLASICVV
jgi:hypothetical protein